VKQSNSSRLLLLGLSAICLAILVFAGLKATHYDAPTNSAVTQQAEKNKLAALASKPTEAAVKPAPPHSTSHAAITSQPSVAKPVPIILVNTGPGSAIPLFLLSVGSVYGICIWLRYRQTKKFTDV
jgi:hypothetical protein